jgi:hypothetical protein
MRHRYERQSYIPVEEFIKANRQKLEERLLSSLHTGNLHLYGISQTAYENLVHEVISMSSHDVARFMRRYSTTPMEKKMGPIEKKRQLLLDIQTLASGDKKLG